MHTYIDTLAKIKTDGMSAVDRKVTLNHLLMCYQVSLSDLATEVLKGNNRVAKSVLKALLA